ncbi:MAG: hypothetical protein E7256_13735 [Lachnospiraceae bacterium]|nr:hypothetical protein [Lachnospiraceae bacterium]
MKEEFIKKMIAAKKLEYEAFKEIMPDGMKAHVNLFEEQMTDAMKDIAYTCFFGGMTGADHRETAGRTDTGRRRNGMDDKEDTMECDITAESKERCENSSFDKPFKASTPKTNKTDACRKETQGRTKKIQVE